MPAPERFEGKRLFQAPIASALPDPGAFLSQAKREAPIYSAPAATAAAPASSAGGKKIVAVTACPTGVAHTFMAAEALAVAIEHQEQRGATSGQLAVGISRGDIELVLSLGLGWLEGARQNAQLGVLDFFRHLRMRHIFVNHDSIDETCVLKRTADLALELDQIKVYILAKIFHCIDHLWIPTMSL